ncbi:O-antigen/teichoic acid export membrane protein [Rhizobium sp. BK650]|uniref:oligosaccharide flippase family protein n=1 Tax=Rhizobium sp. BK650 TaxID=2586990 RepID=UPI00161913EA|nr:oligosaccharide flippase family protein [Rhizobium sp. BK650]MBB3660413.1 O-antigen/teichoic acid export membrane protein [Rhizobium sp. BK650]
MDTSSAAAAEQPGAKEDQGYSRRASTSRDALWVSGARLVSQLCGIGTLLIAARVLSPAEVGVFAMVSSIVLLQSKIAEAGWSEYLIAAPHDKDLPGTVLYCALASGLAFTILGLIGLTVSLVWLAPSGSIFSTLLLLMATIVPGTFIICQSGILVRRRRLRELAFYQAASEFSGLLVTATGLLLGWGIVALAAGRCCVVLVALLMSTCFARWLPRFEFHLTTAREALAYSTRLLASRLMQFAQSYGAEFLIVFFIGATEVGLYRMASRIVGAVTELVSEPVRMLAWSYFSRQQGATEGLSRLTCLVMAATAFAALPVFMGLAVISVQLVSVLLGAQWLAAAPVLILLATARGIAVIQMLNEPVLSIIGRVALLPRLNLLFTATSLACLAIAGWIHPDLVNIALAQVLAAAITTSVSLYFLQRGTGFRWPSLLRRVLPAGLGACIMVGAVGFALHMAGGSLRLPFVDLLMGVVVGGFAYLIIAWSSGRALMAELNHVTGAQ